MGQWWGPALHRDHEQKVRRHLRETFADDYQCRRRDCSFMVGIHWLSFWEQYEDGHGRIRAVLSCTAGDVFSMLDLDVTREGNLVWPEVALPQAA